MAPSVPFTFFDFISKPGDCGYNSNLSLPSVPVPTWVVVVVVHSRQQLTVVYIDKQRRQLKHGYMNTFSLQKSTLTPMQAEERLKGVYQEWNSTQVLGQPLAWQLEEQREH